jgi:hypothetical protein
MKIKFSYIIGFSAFLLAVSSGYYSVFGLSQLFAGASLAVIIMASSLEFSKIVVVSFLERHWKDISIGLKIYLTIGVFILVGITSAGIYGFLSSAYQKTAHKLELSEGKLGIINVKKGLFEKNITDNQAIITTKTNRVSLLTNLRTTQESRLDGANGNSNKKTARNDIDKASNEIQKLNNEIDALNAKNTISLDSVNVYATQAIETQSNDATAGEIGPLKFLSQLTNTPMDKIVNYFILLLIFVFDPLAVALVIATNKMISIEKSIAVKPSVELPLKVEDLVETSDINEFDIDEFDEEDSEYEPEPMPELIEETISNQETTIEPIAEIVSELETSPEVTIEPIVEVVVEPEVIPEPIKYKKLPVITTGKVELENIKEIKEKTNRGFSRNIPNPSSNTVQRIGSNKIFKDNNSENVIFKRGN